MESIKSNAASIIVALIIAISIIICAYFIALGSRYETMDNTFILDKWTKQIYVMDGQKIGKLED